MFSLQYLLLDFQCFLLLSKPASQQVNVRCDVQVVKKAKLTKVMFNPKWPILLVGDDKGCVTSLKLSPNLRKRSVPEKGQKVGSGARDQMIGTVGWWFRLNRGGQAGNAYVHSKITGGLQPASMSVRVC